MSDPQRAAVSKCCRASIFPESDEHPEIIVCGVCRKPAEAVPVAQEVALASTEELIQELMSRFDHGAFVGMKSVENKPELSEYKNMTYRRWKGNSATTQGLLFETATIIAADYMERRVDCDDVGRSID